SWLVAGWRARPLLGEGWSELQSRVLREVDAVPGVDLRGVLAGELVRGVAERLGDLDDVLAVVTLDLDVRRDHRPLIDLDLGAVEQEARAPVLLIRLRSVAEQPEQPVGLLEITDLDLDLISAIDPVVTDPLVGQGDLAAVVPEPEPLRLIAGNDVVDVAALDAPPDGGTAGVEDPLRDVAGADVEDLGLVLGSHVAKYGRSWPATSSHRIAKTRWRRCGSAPHVRQCDGAMGDGLAAHVDVLRHRDLGLAKLVGDLARGEAVLQHHRGDRLAEDVRRHPLVSRSLAREAQVA